MCVELRQATRCMPSLTVIGAMKCGTTNLMLFLSMHPNLRTSEGWGGWPRESRFFSQATDSREAVGLWRDYLALYPPYRRGQLTFDKSPNYVVNPVVPTVLRRIAPSMKLVATVRNPTKRAYSHFQHDCRNRRIVRERGRVRRESDPDAEARLLDYPCSAHDFHNMVTHDLREGLRDRCEWAYKEGRGDSGAIPRGFYACQLRRWLDAFPRNQLLVLVFETFVANRQATLEAVAEIESFVGLEHYDYDHNLKVAVVERLYAALPSRRSAYEPMLPETAGILDEVYCVPNQNLIELLPDLKSQRVPWPCLSQEQPSS